MVCRKVNRAVLVGFNKCFPIGLIHRRYRPVHYSPSSRSALAEAELVYKENHVSHSVYVAFDLDPRPVSSVLNCANLSSPEPIQLLVWTTTPWTLTANMVCTLIRHIVPADLKKL